MGNGFVASKLRKALRALAFVFLFVTSSQRGTFDIPLVWIVWWVETVALPRPHHPDGLEHIISYLDTSGTASSVPDTS